MVSYLNLAFILQYVRRFPIRFHLFISLSSMLDFYGKKAEEIAGKVIFNGKDTVGFGGTRGEITK